LLNRKEFTLLLALALAPAGALAQSEPGAPPANVRVRMGPLFVNPTLALTNAGVDNNVFNDADSDSPKEDFTMTVTPAVDLWLRFGRTWLNSSIREDIVYFHTYESERSANNSSRVNWVIPLNRLTVTPGAAYLYTRERPGFEIDTRAQRTEIDFNASVEMRALSKTFFGVRGDRRTTGFEQDAEYDNTNLHDELNRTVTTAALTLRHQVTPLTSITFDVSREQDRFEFSPGRNADSTAITGGVKLDPFALIKGSATFGYRDFKPLARAVPGYQGSTAAVDLSYVAFGSTKLGVTLTRDVQYSYDINQPYYLLTGVTASISQQIYGPVDVVGRIGGSQLEYRDRAGAAVEVSNRVDHIQSYGGGLGYHLGSDMRLGFNIDQQRRLSGVDSKQYNGLRYGFAVTYGS
jgi:hypothetical protein